MSVADLYNVPGTPEEMAKWSWLHMAHHRQINGAILEQYDAALPEYILDPIAFDNPTTFLDQHQQMHNNQDAILGIAGYDLMDVDLTDPGQLAGWIFLNAQLHVSEAEATETW